MTGKNGVRRSGKYSAMDHRWSRSYGCPWTCIRPASFASARWRAGAGSRVTKHPTAALSRSITCRKSRKCEA